MQIINFYPKKIEEYLSTCVSACSEANVCVYIYIYIYIDG